MNKTITNKTGNLILELRQETCSAWLTIKKTGKLIDENEILALVEEAGIKYGFDEAIRHIRDNSLEKEFDVPFPIAISSDKETTSTLHYNCNPDLQLNLANGISFSDLGRLNFMNAGSCVAKYSNNIFEQGGSIYDIFGELINPTSVDEDTAKLLVGDGVSFDTASGEFLAQKSGYPFLDEQGCISVLNLLIVNADDIPSETRLHIPIDTIVHGNLAFANFNCEGNLTIKGDLHSCQILCAQDLFVEGEIIGTSGKGIQASGDIYCQSIKDSQVLCNGQLRFSGVIENSILACSQEIFGEDSNSEIRGGTIQAGGSISMATASHAEGSKTEIEIAISPYFRALLMQMTRELVRLKEDTEGNALEILDLQSRIKTCEAELDNQLNTFLKRPTEDRKSIKALQEVNPPVLFRVLKHSYYIKNHEQNLEFVEKE